MRKNRSPLLRAATSGVEVLEDRKLFAITVTTPGSGVLNVTGTSNNDRIVIRENQDTNRTVVRDNVANVDYVYNEIFDTINVDSRQGNDRVRIVIASNFENVDQEVNVKLGSGLDEFVLEAAAEAPLPVVNTLVVASTTDIINSFFDLNVEGGSDYDNIDVDFRSISFLNSDVGVDVNSGTGGDLAYLRLPDFNNLESITDSNVDADFFMDGGEDSFRLVATTDVRNSDVQLNVSGANGIDDVDLGGEQIGRMALGLYEGSTFTVDTDLGNGNDELESDMDWGGAGFAIQDGSSFALNGVGGNGDDVINYALLNISGGSSAPINGNVTFTAEGDAGDDELFVAGTTSTLLSLPTGSTLTVDVDGGANYDYGIIDLATSPDSNGLYDIALRGGGAADILGLRFQNNGTNTAGNYVGGKALLDGGGGTDRWDVDGNVNLGFITVQNAEVEDDTILPGG